MLSNRKFGLEFEHINAIEHNDLALALSKAKLPVDRYATGRQHCAEGCYSGWQVKSDLSVSTSSKYPYSVELVSPPLLLSDVAQIRKALSVVRPTAAINSSCGLHVHVSAPELGENILDRSMAHWRTHIEKAWSNVEKVFFTYVTPARRSSDFCRPGVNWTRKYSAMNVSSLVNRPTIEFRLHSPTMNAKKAVAFAALCVSFLDFVVGAKNKTPVVEPDLMLDVPPKSIVNKTGQFYLHRVFDKSNSSNGSNGSKRNWIVEREQTHREFPTLLMAHESMKTELGLSGKTPWLAFHFPDYGNAMSELCKMFKVPSVYRSYLEDRYEYMFMLYGPVVDLDCRRVVVEDEDDFYNEPLLPESASPQRPSLQQLQAEEHSFEAQSFRFDPNEGR